MKPNKRKILVIENESNQFIKIAETIESYLGDHFDVYPKIDGDKGTPENFNYFLEDIVEMNDTETLLGHYKDIDLFIIDILLKSDESVDGLELEKKIRHMRGENRPEILLISSRDDKLLKNLLWKGPDFHSNLIKKIIELFPDVEKRDKDKRFTYWKYLELNSKRFGMMNTIIVLIKDAGRRWRQLIHMLITVIFYILIMLTSGYGFMSMWREFSPSGERIQKTEAIVAKTDSISTASTEADSAGTANQYLNDIIHKRKVEETMILEHAEKIFLYLLPIFIVFGFYIYYNSNIKIYFYDGKILPEDQQASVKSMNLTKSIFVSSIISFTVIKVIDELFFNAKPDHFLLYASGVLLLILMGYFILLNQHNSENHSK